MTTDATLDALFTGAWENPDGTAAAVLADWILEHAPPPNTDAQLVARHGYERGDKEACGVLTVYAPAGLSGSLGVSFSEPAMGIQDVKHLSRAAFGDEFPKWLNEQLDFLYYVLSK